MSKVKKLILGHGINLRTNKPALKNQVHIFLRIWRNYSHHDFGIERLIRLFLASIQFLTPSLYLKHFASNLGTTGRKILIEFYVLSKMLLPFLALVFGLFDSFWILVLVIMFLFETVIYVTSLIFISDASRESVQPRRSLALLFVNFFEIIFDFAFIYIYFDTTQGGFFTKELNDGTSAIYFSFVTAATVGYGDIAPAIPLAKRLVIVQISLTFVFVGLFFNYFSNLLHKAQDIDTDQKFKKTRHRAKKSTSPD
jgi:hypothetical protein